MIGTWVGFEGLSVRLCEDGMSGFTSLESEPPLGDELGLMLVAGYAAVGSLLGEDAKVANQQGDQHHLPDSDLMRGMKCAEAALGKDARPDDFVAHLEGLERVVLDELERPSLRNAIKHVAALLYEVGFLNPGLLGAICTAHR